MSLPQQPTAPAAGAANPEAVRLDVEARARLRRDVRDYFEEQYDRTLADMVRANVVNWWRRLGAMLVGVSLLLGSLALYVLGYRMWLMQELLAAAAGVVLIGWALVYLRSGTQGSLSEIEQGIDRLREHDIEELARRADERLAMAQTDVQQKLVLRAFPDRQRLPGAFVGARIGSDGRARFTPAGLTVLALGPDTVAAFMGAVDLSSGETLYERLVEFPYRDITALELVVSSLGDADSESDPKKKGPMQSMAEAAARRMRARRPQKDKEALAIHLASGVNVETVLVDRGFVPAWKGQKLGLVAATESEADYRAVWQALRAKWRAALAGRVGGQ